MGYLVLFIHFLNDGRTFISKRRRIQNGISTWFWHLVIRTYFYCWYVWEAFFYHATGVNRGKYLENPSMESEGN
ncbi:MAG: hypothetical protein RJA90_1864 [Bacteroidota bacterium]